MASAAPHGGVHMVGSSVNIPDMTASLNAKVTVSEHHQANPTLLASVYDDMASKFENTGLNMDAVAAMRQYFDGLDHAGSVRLGVLFIRDCCPDLADLVHQAARAVSKVLPSGTPLHLNDPSHYHVTVFMTSQPHTLRPDPFDPDWHPPAADAPPALWAAPQASTLAREQEAMRAAAAEHAAPSLRVHRLFMADSGTLLLCSVEEDGTLAALRRRLRADFPGAPPRQSTIVHASIGRVLGSRALEPGTVRAVARVCQDWSQRVARRQWSAAGLTHVQETVFTTVEGPRLFLPFAPPPEAS